MHANSTWYKPISILCLSMLMYVSLAAQLTNTQFTFLTTAEGLSHNLVNCVLKDKYGYMWFATQDGLNKYDGNKFVVYQHKDGDTYSLRDNDIQTLYEDREGNLWIGSNGGGLSLYDRKRDRFINYIESATDSNTISNSEITSIHEDSRGNLWVGTYWNLNVLDRATKKVTRFTHNKKDSTSISDNIIYCIFEDSKKNLWVGTYDGLNRYNYNNKTFTRYQHKEKDPTSISHNIISAITEDDEGNLWIATRGGGLNLYDHNSKTFSSFKEGKDKNHLIDNHIFSLANAHNKHLWIGAEQGLDYFDIANKTFHHFLNTPGDPHSLNNNSINSIFADENGILWAGTFSGGVNILDQNRTNFTHIKKDLFSRHSLSHNVVTSFAEEDNGNLWIGTDGGGLNFYERATGKFSVFMPEKSSNSLSNASVLALLKDSDNKLWIGTYNGGLNVYDLKTKTFQHYRNGPTARSLSSDIIFALLEDREGNIWIGTDGGGINVLNKKTGLITKYQFNASDTVNSLLNNDVRALYQDSEGSIWIGTYSGALHLFDPLMHRFKHYTATNSNLKGSCIFSIHEDKKKNLWLGTLGGGLAMFDRKKEKCINFTEQDGLASNIANAVVEDAEGNLWIGTSKGISFFNPASKTFKNFGISNGVQGLEFFHNAGLATRNGEILLGGTNGFNIISPFTVRENKARTPVVFSGFKLFNNEVAIGVKGSPLQEHISQSKRIELSYKQSVFTIEFTALNYTMPDKNQYAYLLEGFDKDWNFIGSKHSATYTNLDPGHYTLKVKAANNDGIWSKEVSSIEIIITPPFWKTWWFYIGLTGFVIGCFVLFYNYRINRVQKQKDLLETLVKERTQKLEEMTLQESTARERAEKASMEAEKANQAKSVFLATMSHEIRTPMNGVIGTTALLAETSLDDEQKRYTEIIKTSGENLLSVINDILDFSKIESGKMELENRGFHLRDCIEEVLDLFATKAAHKKIDLFYHLDPAVPNFIMGDSTRLRQVLINLVGNAVKFTNEGEIFIRCSISKSKGEAYELMFEVRDTGIGIPENKLAHLFQAFTQVDSSTTRKYGGTGLGLVISKKLVELMNGSIHVESTSGKGTSFFFSLPTTESKDAVIEQELVTTTELEGKRILIVDDNATNCLILGKQLEYWKYAATICRNAEDALGILSSQSFDLLITDMQMPGMDGAEFARKVKEIYPTLPIVLLSSIGDERFKEYETVFCATLMKPVRQKELHKVLYRQLSKTNALPAQAKIAGQKLTTDFAQSYPLNILIAEDNPVNQTLIKMIMKKLGYTPFIAADGRQAVQAMQKEYDIILMDVQMPEMDGLEATKAIRKLPVKQPVIIAVTANAMQDDREACLQAGMDDYISKPIQLDQLVQVLEKWAKKNKLQASL